jgi:hypothetical protein
LLAISWSETFQYRSVTGSNPATIDVTSSVRPILYTGVNRTIPFELRTGGQQFTQRTLNFRIACDPLFYHLTFCCADPAGWQDPHGEDAPNERQ